MVIQQGHSSFVVVARCRTAMARSRRAHRRKDLRGRAARAVRRAFELGAAIRHLPPVHGHPRGLRRRASRAVRAIRQHSRRGQLGRPLRDGLLGGARRHLAGHPGRASHPLAEVHRRRNRGVSAGNRGFVLDVRRGGHRRAAHETRGLTRLSRGGPAGRDHRTCSQPLAVARSRPSPAEGRQLPNRSAGDRGPGRGGEPRGRADQ